MYFTGALLPFKRKGRGGGVKKEEHFLIGRKVYKVEVECKNPCYAVSYIIPFPQIQIAFYSSLSQAKYLRYQNGQKMV